MIFYTYEPGAYGSFLNIQIADSRDKVTFKTSQNWPFITTVYTSENKRLLTQRIFNAYKVKLEYK